MLDPNLIATSKAYRLNALYHIVDRDGNDRPFRMTHVQADVFNNLHTRNLILKARQLGMSTFSVLYLVDEAIWQPNSSCGIVSYSLEHAQHIFKRIIGYALDHLPSWLRVEVKSRSAREITFGNGSVLRVDTTLRGGSYQNVLVSEFGKTCARNPMKAEEVITGTLQAVPKDGRVIIESTGEGNSGYFAEMVQSAAQRGNENLSPLDYKLFFYDWMQEPSYQLEQKVSYDVQLTDYFNDIEKQTGKTITQPQRNWYSIQYKTLHSKIKQEFPSTVSEAFLSSSDAFYFAETIAKAYTEGRCLYTSLYDGLLPVYVSMDIGVNDLTVIVFFQLAHGEIRIIDYYEDKNKDSDFYAKFLLQDKKYLYHTIFLPHDSTKKDALDVDNSYERDFRRLFSGTATKFHVLKRMDKQIQISHARIKLERCVFNLTRVKPLLDHMAKYRKKWNESTGRYLEEPLHTIACFVGETLVKTDKGDRRIDSLKIGDKVLTPNGYKSILEVFFYRTKDLVKVTQGNHKVICTPHHKLFTNKGLVTADSLCYDSHVITHEESRIWKKIASLGKTKNLGFKDYFLSMNRETLSCLMDSSIKKISLDIGLEDQKEKELFIERFGSIIKAIYLLDLISIISTRTNQTTRLKILSLFRTPTTCDSTCLQRSEKNYHEVQSEKLLKLQKLGTRRMRADNGIANMQKKYLKTNPIFQKSAYAAKRFISQFKSLLNIALEPVGQHIEENQDVITKIESAKLAEKSLSAIDFREKEAALAHVEPCLDIEREVYDLTVKDDNCYFANNFLVSNSNYADSFMYAMQGVSHLEAAGGLSGALEKHRKAVESRNIMLS